MTSVIENLKSRHIKDFTNKLEKAIQSSDPETQKKFLELFEEYDKRFQNINENCELQDKGDIFERDFVKEILNNSPFKETLITIEVFYSQLLLSNSTKEDFLTNPLVFKKHLVSFMKSLREPALSKLNL